MDLVNQFLFILVCGYADCVSTIFASLLSGSEYLFADDSVALAFAMGAGAFSSIPEGIIAAIRRWHAGYDDQFQAINNLTNMLEAGQTKWAVPVAMMAKLIADRDALRLLVDLCHSTSCSTVDRAARNSLLQATVSYCLTVVKTWVLSEYYQGNMTADDVHALGFYIPGETGGHRARKESTDVVAEVKVIILNADFIRIVIDQAAGENAALVEHGWPKGVKLGVIVITSIESGDEVYHKVTNRLHTKIQMPEGSHKKDFVAKAAFLQHVDDEPVFGAEQTFSMPSTTEDLLNTYGRQKKAAVDAQQSEIERQRLEIERLEAEKGQQKE
jgi:hypothetical protein